jgi:hypothetical protein
MIMAFVRSGLGDVRCYVMYLSKLSVEVVMARREARRRRRRSEAHM